VQDLDPNSGPNRSLLFLYGTLKRGKINHHLVAGQRFVALAQTQPGFRLYELDGYPGMVAASDDHDGVFGEIWQIDATCLAVLDAFEGVPERLYRRVAIPLLPPHENTTVEAYIYAQSTTGRRVIGNRWNG
jgi:gamma-glutamylaminecyclotransferase